MGPGPAYCPEPHRSTWKRMTGGLSGMNWRPWRTDGRGRGPSSDNYPVADEDRKLLA